ncbi:hypothetical protein MMC30_004857 [Trapelia coarctata]|nr:hypothetical protein [Trapelia coarctata]
MTSSNLPPKPSIVIVPGSFSPVHFYAKIIDQLIANGYEAQTIDMPSVGRKTGVPGATMAEDAASIQSMTSKLADEDKDVTIVTHSYGGIPGTESVKGMGKADREKEGKKGGVVRIVYLTSLVAPVGLSLKTLMGDTLPDWLKVEGEYMTAEVEAGAEINFSDIPRSEALEWQAKMPQHSTTSFAGKLTYPAYKYIPVSFIMCEADKVIPLEFQKSMVEMIEKESGKKVDVHVLNSGHCPNISMPGRVAEEIMKAVGETA